MMPGVSYVIYGCSSARTAGVSLYWSFTLEENITGYYPKQGDRWQFEKAN